MKFVTRFLIDTEESFFLFGPRGVGKSTWLRNRQEKALWINLLDPGAAREYSARPERLKEAVAASNQQCIIIDEIQKIPELLSVVHDLIEEKQGLQFILTGSSARKLKRSGVNLLASRAFVRSLHPFMAAELGSEFDLEQALQFGLVPVIVDRKEKKEALRAYVGLYLKEEVQSEGLVRNVGDFSRFLEVVSFSYAAQVNVSNIARECGVSRKIIDSYLSILEDLLLSFTLPVFTKRAQRALVGHEKFYFFDVGVFRTLRAVGPLDQNKELNGLALEGLVAQHLRAWNEYQGTPYELFYWRTRAGNEVDFIVYGPEIFWAIEVKHSTYIHPKDLNGLTAFLEDYPEATAYLLYRGKERLQKGKILCLPVETFLRELSPQQPKERSFL